MNLVEWLKAQQGEETDEQFAARLGISPSLWSMWQSRQRRPGRKTLKKLAEAFPEYKTVIVDLALAS